MPGSSVPVEALLRRSIYILTVSACFAGLTLVELAVLVVALESRDRLLPSDVPALRKLSLPELRASDAACRRLRVRAARRKLSLPELRASDAVRRKLSLPELRASDAARRKLSLPELRASDAVRRKLPPPSPAEVRPSNAEGATGGPIILSLSPHVARSFTTRTSDRCRRLVVNLVVCIVGLPPKPVPFKVKL